MYLAVIYRVCPSASLPPSHQVRWVAVGECWSVRDVAGPLLMATRPAVGRVQLAGQHTLGGAVHGRAIQVGQAADYLCLPGHA